MILEAKEKYIRQLSNKLSDPSTVPKKYWKIIDRFVKNKKTPMVPPLLVNDKIISKLSEKSILGASLWKIKALYLLFA